MCLFVDVVVVVSVSLLWCGGGVCVLWMVVVVVCVSLLWCGGGVCVALWVWWW